MTHQSKITKDSTVSLSRRSFIVSTGAAGLAFGFAALPGASALAATGGAYDPNHWFSIGADGNVTVRVAKAEMGQHIASTLAQILAEELGASWAHMKIELIGNDPRYNDPVLGAILTGGSWSTLMNFDLMSRCGAAGRMALIDAAAGMLGVQPGQCTASESRVTATNGKSVTFAEIVKSGKASKVYTADDLKAITLKTPDQYTMIGKELLQLDIPAKTRGEAKYSIDHFVPGMVYGRVVTPPVRYGAKVTAVDDSEAKKVPGFIKAVTVEDATATTTGWVVAVAEKQWQAILAAKALKVTYDKGPNAGVSSESILAEAKRLVGQPGGELYFKSGDAAATLSSAA